MEAATASASREVHQLHSRQWRMCPAPCARYTSGMACPRMHRSLSWNTFSPLHGSALARNGLITGMANTTRQKACRRFSLLRQRHSMQPMKAQLIPIAPLELDHAVHDVE